MPANAITSSVKHVDRNHPFKINFRMLFLGQIFVASLALNAVSMLEEITKRPQPFSPPQGLSSEFAISINAMTQALFEFTPHSLSQSPMSEISSFSLRLASAIFFELEAAAPTATENIARQICPEFHSHETRHAPLMVERANSSACLPARLRLLSVNCFWAAYANVKN